jgi:hypothetical protein
MTKSKNHLKNFQRLSLIGLALILLSLPIQIHLFSQSGIIENQTSSVIFDKVATSSIVQSNSIQSNEALLTALESQRNNVKELKIPVPKVVAKPVVKTPPKVEPIEEKKESTQVTPVASSADPTVSELKSLIITNCAKYSCNPDQLIRVMMCESGGTNHRNTYYKGPFQFLTSTFYANAKRVGIENADVLDARQQVQVAAYMFGIGQAKQWGCK